MRLVVTVGIALLWTAAGVAQEAASPIYKLPAEGTWAEYAWKSFEGSETRGQLRVVVGKRVADRNGPRRWVEFAMLPAEKTQAPSWRLVLVDEAAFEREKGMRNAVREAYGKSKADGEYAPLSANERDGFLTMGIEGKLRVLGKPPLKLSSVTYQTQLAETEDAGKKLVYRVWLAPETPFGWARFTITPKDGARPRFEADLVATSMRP